MPTYISLIKLSHQGITSIKESPGRIDSAREVLRSFGAEIKDFYFAMGQYDFVIVTEAPDDTALAKGLLALGAAGNIRTETMHVFREDQYRELVDAVQPSAENPALAVVETVRQKLAESIEDLQRALRRD